MRLLILSDLHFEFHQDGGNAFVNDLAPPEDVDVCILAGDIAVGPGIEGALKLFCQRYKHVVYVHGNHEFYNGSRRSTISHTQRAIRKLDNLTWLHPHEDCDGSGPVEIDGQRFIGAPLWFPSRGNWWHQMNDYHVISDLEDWVYDENAATLKMLEGVEADDVVITHHLPSHQSVHPMYAGSELNAFFVCDVEPLIMTKQPKLWVHGHTHFSFDYELGSTRVVCNPFGYARHEENAKFDPSKVVEV